MKPIKPVVPGVDLPVTVIAKDQPQYIPLPAYIDPGGAVLTCWHLTWRERLTVLCIGNVWLTVLAMHRPLQPIKLETVPPDFEVGFAAEGKR
jgi:hypothetical protein